jgi:hypothetical protein
MKTTLLHGRFYKELTLDFGTGDYKIESTATISHRLNTNR